MIKEYKLNNSNGISIVIISYGGIIKEINTPSSNGKLENIVLGYKDNNQYLNDKYFMGALIGRYANRISKSCFKLNDKIIFLDKNEKNNHLHGGKNGFHKKNWNLVEYDSENQKFLELSIFSKDFDSGYPGNLNCNVRYSLNDSNEFKIEFFADSDKDTIFNPTSHAYFNLNPSNNSILNHKLKISSNDFIPINNEFLPTGEIEKIANTPFDFSFPREIGEQINIDDKQLEIARGYDHCFVLKKETDIAAEISEKISGRKLVISTDQPGIQLYTGNHLSGNFNQNQGLCLETQHYPNSPNNINFPSTILKAQKKFYSKTTYIFNNKT